MREKREALPRDGTLWIASHRDSSLSITQEGSLCQDLRGSFDDWQIPMINKIDERGLK